MPQRHPQQCWRLCVQTTCSHSGGSSPDNTACSMLMVESVAALNASDVCGSELVQASMWRVLLESRWRITVEVVWATLRTMSPQVQYEVAEVKNPLPSVSSMMDAGATVTFSPHGVHIPKAGCGLILLERIDNVYWLTSELAETQLSSSDSKLCRIPDVCIYASAVDERMAVDEPRKEEKTCQGKSAYLVSRTMMHVFSTT